MALKPAKLFGNSVESWLNLQRNVDIWNSENSLQDEIEQIKQLTA